MKKKIDKENNIIKFPKKMTKLERQVEAILFAAEEPWILKLLKKEANKFKY